MYIVKSARECVFIGMDENHLIDIFEYYYQEVKELNPSRGFVERFEDLQNFLDWYDIKLKAVDENKYKKINLG